MPTSKDPVKRARQVANLVPGGNQSHGAKSEAIIRPLAQAYLVELQREFPDASERVLKLQARRLAKLERLAGWLERKGELANQRRGTVYPASSLEESITAAFLNTQAKLEAQRTTADPYAELRAALNAPEDDDDD
jgi:BMFP domain-containing protein YqiC